MEGSGRWSWPDEVTIPRGGDLHLVTLPGWLPAHLSTGRGTDHGSGWNPDTHVPLSVPGERHRSGEVLERVQVTGIVPTLSLLLGQAFPDAADGPATTGCWSAEVIHSDRGFPIGHRERPGRFRCIFRAHAAPGKGTTVRTVAGTGPPPPASGQWHPRRRPGDEGTAPVIGRRWTPVASCPVLYWQDELVQVDVRARICSAGPAVKGRRGLLWCAMWRTGCRAISSSAPHRSRFPVPRCQDCDDAPRWFRERRQAAQLGMPRRIVGKHR